MSNENGDGEIVKLLQSGFRYAMSLAHDKAQAEDLVQEAWLAILKSKGPKNRPYLFCSIRSRFVNQGKRNQLLSFISIDDVPEIVDVGGTDFDYKIDLLRTELGPALSQLRAVERETLYLMVVEGYTAQEVADLTKQSRNTILSINHRARQKVRRYFEKESAVMGL